MPIVKQAGKTQTLRVSRLTSGHTKRNEGRSATTQTVCQELCNQLFREKQNYLCLFFLLQELALQTLTHLFSLFMEGSNSSKGNGVLHLRASKAQRHSWEGGRKASKFECNLNMRPAVVKVFLAASARSIHANLLSCPMCPMTPLLCSRCHQARARTSIMASCCCSCRKIF